MYDIFWNRISDVLKASIIGKFFFAVVSMISGAFKSSKFYSFFAGNNMSGYADGSKIVPFVRKTVFDSKFTDFMSESIFVWAFSEMPKNVFNSSVSLLSVYLLPAGLLMFVNGFGNVLEMIVSALIIIFGVMLLGIKTNVGSVLNNSFALKKFCDFFEIDLDSAPTKNYNKRFYFVTICFSVVVGAVSYLFGFKLSVIAFFVVLFLPLLISSPMLILILAFIGGTLFSSMPAFVLCLLLLLVTLCRMIKRIDFPAKLRAPYIMVLIYSFVTLFYTLTGFSGSDGMLAGAVVFSIMVIAKNFDRFKKLVFSLSVSTIIPGVIGVYQFLTGQGGTGWTSEKYVGGLARISSTFANPNVYGEYIIFTISICLVAFLVSKGIKQRIFFGGVFLLQLVNLALTYSRGCYFSVIFIMLIVVWCCDKRLLGFGVFALPVLPYVLPQNIITRILSVGSYLKDTSVTYRFSIWKGSMAVIANHWYQGAGVGTVAYMLFYKNYMVPGTPAQHSHNTFMQIAIELGVLGLLIFLFVILFSIKDVSNVIRKCNIRAKFVVIPLMASFGGIFVQSFFDYVFYNNIVFLAFWITMGLLLSGINIVSADDSFLKSYEEKYRVAKEV